MRLTSYLVFLTLCHKIFAGYTSSYSARQLDACVGMIHSVAEFCDEEEDATCACENLNNIATVMGCGVASGVKLHVYASYYVEYCGLYCDVFNLNESYLLTALDYYNENAVSVTDIPNFNASIPVDVPIIIDSEFRSHYARAYEKYLGNYTTSAFYSYGVLGYWAVIMIISSIANWSMVLFPTMVFKLTGPIVNSWRKYVTIPALHKKKDQAKYLYGIPMILIPSRFESLVVFGFTVLTVGLTAALYSYDPLDPIYSSRGPALSRYIGVRSGIIGTFLVPLLILFSGRNNIMCYLTRIHYNTFIVYHKYIARMATILIFIHSVAYTISLSLLGHYTEEVAERYMVWGVIGTIFMCILMFQALLYFRRTAYEIFILLHFVFSFLFIVGSWIHVIDLNYGELMYAATAVWAFDRVVRIIRLCWFGIADAKVVLLADETLRIVIPKPKLWKVTPGGYAYIHFFRPTCFWQSHPFTFAAHPSDPTKIVLYCKVKGGITHGLYKYLSTMPDNTATIKVSLEGPYGHAAPTKKYDNAVYIATGNGIPGLYSEIYDAITNCKNEKQQIRLIWIIREYRSLLWFHEELQSIKNDRVNITVYVTHPNSTEYLQELTKINSSEENKLDETKKKDSDDENDINSKITGNPMFNHIEFKTGRPDVYLLVNQEVLLSNGPTAFVVCGYAPMVDTVRMAVADNVGKSKGKRIDFFDQIETWA